MEDFGFINYRYSYNGYTHYGDILIKRISPFQGYPHLKDIPEKEHPFIGGIYLFLMGDGWRTNRHSVTSVPVVRAMRVLEQHLT